MLTVRNTAKERLAAGELALGMGIRISRTVEVAKMMKTCGYDWLFIDMEHSTLDLDSAAQLCVAAQSAGVAPVVRVPGYEHHHASRVLDGGAQGIVVPHVDTPETAARIVRQCRFPPEGRRSVAGGFAQLDFAPHPMAEATAALNASTLVIVMIETPVALENVDAIAAVEGVDVLLVGSNDLSTEMGIPGQVGDPAMMEAQGKVIAACRRHGRYPGLGGVGDPALVERCVEMGMRLILCGNDLSMLMAGASARARLLRALPVSRSLAGPEEHRR